MNLLPCIFSSDLDGSFGVKGWVKCFDSTVKKTESEISRVVEALLKTLGTGQVASQENLFPKP
jgi:hypothetical protein